MEVLKVFKNKLRDRANKNYLSKLKNKDFSLISSNCNGGFILNDLNLKFNSPTINLFMFPDHFIKYVSNLAYYSNCALEFKRNLNITYPVGYIEDIEIHFMHYKNEAEARQKWVERTKRIKYNNIFILMTDRDGCSMQDLLKFDKLPYQNKIVFTHKYYPELKSAYYIKGFENQGNVGDLFRYKSYFSLKKFYDDFNYIDWFNQKK